MEQTTRQKAYWKNPVGGTNFSKRGTCSKCGLTTLIGALAKHIPICKGINHCLRCKKQIPQDRKYCGHSCAGSGIRGPWKERKPCKNCGKLTLKPIYCSRICMGAYIKSRHELRARGGIKTEKAIFRALVLDQCGECAICCNFQWQNKLIPLQLDHIDGNPENWAYTNLRLLCPNCHAQTPTFGARNKGNGRYLRRLRYAKTGFC